MNVNLNFNIPNLLKSNTNIQSIPEYPLSSNKTKNIQSLDMSKSILTENTDEKTIDKSNQDKYNFPSYDNINIDKENKNTLNKFDKAIRDNEIKEQKV